MPLFLFAEADQEACKRLDHGLGIGPFGHQGKARAALQVGAQDFQDAARGKRLLILVQPDFGGRELLGAPHERRRRTGVDAVLIQNFEWGGQRHLERQTLGEERPRGNQTLADTSSGPRTREINGSDSGALRR